MEDISNIDYWKKRYIKSISQHEIHQSIFHCPLELWKRIEAKHKTILEKVIDPFNDILDVGCGYGRLISLLPTHWTGHYVGVDLCPHFIDEARKTYPQHNFMIHDITSIRDLYSDEHEGKLFDWAVLISMRPMIIRNSGGLVWDNIHDQLKRIVSRILYLEYDENDSGEIEYCG